MWLSDTLLLLLLFSPLLGSHKVNDFVNCGYATSRDDLFTCRRDASREALSEQLGARRGFPSWSNSEWLSYPGSMLFTQYSHTRDAVHPGVVPFKANPMQVIPPSRTRALLAFTRGNLDVFPTARGL